MPGRESERINVISKLLNADITSKNELQEMVELASYICQTSMAMINLIDHQTQHIRFKVGIKLSQLQKEDTFCQYIKNEDDLLVIPDALKDQRFYDNILVVNSPFVRFYAGLSLVTLDGLTIGSLCVLGNRAKELTASQKQRLKVLSRRIVEIIEMEYGLVA